MRRKNREEPIPWRRIELPEALTIASQKTFSKYLKTDDSVIAVFEDGTEIRWESQYDGGWSEYTPGNGIEAPEIFMRP